MLYLIKVILHYTLVKLHLFGSEIIANEGVANFRYKYIR